MPHQVIAVIPARLASTRLARKVLRPLAGQPMLAWVYQAAKRCALLDRVLIATDSGEVMAFASDRGYDAVITPADCASGTDRIYHVSQTVPADIYVNVQGDEPLLQPEHIEALLKPFTNPEVEVSTLSTVCPDDYVENPNVVKVVTSRDGRALYFSRAAIPYDRDRTGPVAYRKHLGLYAYSRDALQRFPALPSSSLEAAERLEQLRFLENGIDIHVIPTPIDTIGVDTEADAQAVEAALLQRGSLG